ncbi:hypothetical protein [Salipiger sp.]|uniref:hypothetical protein n=1 Tax=Salipiger sp. TaxID=2078585 RepID=UPI003A988445
MAGKSVAVWTKGEAADAQTHEVHINYWRLEGGEASWLSRMKLHVCKAVRRKSWAKTSKQDMLEIGFWVWAPDKVSEASIYLPFKVERADIFDCADSFKKSEISQAIFNEPVTVTHGADNAPVIIAKIDGEIYTSIFLFEKLDSGRISEGELKIENKGEGTQLTITSKAIKSAVAAASESKKLYFRLRISLHSGGPFVSTIRPFDGALQSGYEEIDYIDFRINESRSLPRDVQESLRKSTSKLKKISFLTAAPISLGLSSNDAPLHKMRVLESAVWGGYVNNLPSHMMVYHWRKDWKNDTAISDFTGFAKFAMRRSGRGRVMKYLLIFLLLSILSSWLAARIDANFGAPSTWLDFLVDQKTEPS